MFSQGSRRRADKVSEDPATATEKRIVSARKSVMIDEWLMRSRRPASRLAELT